MICYLMLLGGAGASIFLHAPFIVATERNCVEFPETGYGFIPIGGSLFLFAKSNAALGKYLVLTGERI